MRKSVLNLIIFTFLICTVSACYEPSEVCLDFYASNYDPSGDNNCQDCCTYPNLVLQFSHRWDSLGFNSNDTLIDDFDNAFVFKQFDFLLSQVELIDTFGNSHFIEDSISITSNDNAAFYKDDFENITLDASSYAIGSVKIEEPISKIKFTLGFDLENVAVSILNTDHVLSVIDSSHTTNGKYIPWKFEFTRDTISGNIESIDADLTDNRVIEVVRDLNNTVGDDIRARVNIEYRKLLEGVNMSTSTNTEIKALINDNISKTFN